jgi:hypothetical protein
MTKSRLAATGLLALAFALGGLAGGAATMLADRETHDRPDPYSHESYAERLARELGLDAGQQRAVVAVMERHQPVMDSIWNTVREQFTAERRAMRADIRAILTPDQVERYNQMVARYDSLRQARSKRQDVNRDRPQHGSR